jgi:hypothetical protein
VVQVINYFQSVTPHAGDVSMMGLSGGGWSTSMMAAPDTRIKLSVPVAGSFPFYLRNVDPNSMGDAEQDNLAMFDENVAADGSGGGVVTWLEVYALGGCGEGRRQIMVSNRYDQFFSGTAGDSFKDIVSGLVAQRLGKGKWDYFLDATHGDAAHREHLISPHVTDQVLLPALLGR